MCEDDVLLYATVPIFSNATVFTIQGESFRGRRHDKVALQVGKPALKKSEYSWAVKPPFRNAGYRRSSNGVPQLLLAD